MDGIVNMKCNEHVVVVVEQPVLEQVFFLFSSAKADKGVRFNASHKRRQVDYQQTSASLQTPMSQRAQDLPPQAGRRPPAMSTQVLNRTKLKLKSNRARIADETRN